MRWPWRRKKIKNTDTPSAEALQKAMEDLERVRARWPEVKARAESLRAGRARNHFGEAMTELFRGS